MGMMTVFFNSLVGFRFGHLCQTRVLVEAAKHMQETRMKASSKVGLEGERGVPGLGRLSVRWGEVGKTKCLFRVFPCLFRFGDHMKGEKWEDEPRRQRNTNG